MMKFGSLMLLLILITIIYLWFSKPNSAQGIISYTVPPVTGKLITVGDHLYFASTNDSLKKYSKSNLEEIDSLIINNCINLCYSEHLDEIIVVAGNEGSVLKYVDYLNMVITSEFDFGKSIGDIFAVQERLYITWDNSGLIEGSLYDPEDLPYNTGVLSEININTMESNWEVQVGTLPRNIGYAGQYIIVSSEECRAGYDEENYEYMYGCVFTVVDKATHETRQFVAGMEWHGNFITYANNKAYVSNPHGAETIYDPSLKGLTILDMTDWQIEHIVLEGPAGSEKQWGVTATYYEEPYLYLPYYNSIYEGSTYFGIYNTLTGELENIELPGIEQYLVFAMKDGNDIYLTSYHGWLIKYTMD